MCLEEESNISRGGSGCRHLERGRGSDLRPGDGHLAKTGKREARLHHAVRLDDREDGVKIIAGGNSCGLRQKQAGVLIGEHHGDSCADVDGVGCSRRKGAQDDRRALVCGEECPCVLHGCHCRGIREIEALCGDLH